MLTVIEHCSLEYWSFEMVVLLSGLLPNPKLETSVLSIRFSLIFLKFMIKIRRLRKSVLHSPQKLNTSYLFRYSLNTCWMVYMISVGLGGAIRSVTRGVSMISHYVPRNFNSHDSLYLYSNLMVTHWYYNSTRVSNELGAGRPQGARLAMCVMVIVAILEGAIVGTTTILVRYVWGKLYSNEDEVITYVARMMPLLALSDFLDGFQCVLSGSKFLFINFTRDSKKIFLNKPNIHEMENLYLSKCIMVYFLFL